MESSQWDGIKVVPWCNKVMSYTGSDNKLKVLNGNIMNMTHHKICKAETLSPHIKGDFPMIAI